MTEYEVNDQPCGKRGYPDKKTARTVANQRMHRGGSRKGKVKHLRAYPCPDCNQWHLSSRP